MNAELEKKLSGLSLEEKSEVVSYLMPLVTPPESDEISPELMKELKRRMLEDDLNPQAAMSLENFKLRWAHRQ